MDINEYQCLDMIREPIADPQEMFFVNHIKKYNAENEYYNHYVKYRNDDKVLVMIITWDGGKWDYTIYPLENE